jgi:hypothetical protein
MLGSHIKRDAAAAIGDRTQIGRYFPEIALVIRSHGSKYSSYDAKDAVDKPLPLDFFRCMELSR